MQKKKKGRTVNKLHTILTVLPIAMTLALGARADVEFDSVGVLAAESVENFSDLHQHAVLLRFRVHSDLQKYWIPSSLDLTAGTIEHNSDAGSFISFGPSYRFEFDSFHAGRYFAEFGLHPTWLARSIYGGRHLGGQLHFTSSLGLGAYLGRQRNSSVVIRYQHTSNAGLERNNPGFNMIAVTVSYYLGGDR